MRKSEWISQAIEALDAYGDGQLHPVDENARRARGLRKALSHSGWNVLVSFRDACGRLEVEAERARINGGFDREPGQELVVLSPLFPIAREEHNAFSGAYRDSVPLPVWSGDHRHVTTF